MVEINDRVREVWPWIMQMEEMVVQSIEDFGVDAREEVIVESVRKRMDFIDEPYVRSYFRMLLHPEREDFYH